MFLYWWLRPWPCLLSGVWFIGLLVSFVFGSMHILRGIWKDYTPLSHPFRMDQIINAVEIICHFWARSFKRLWGISMPCDTLRIHARKTAGWDEGNTNLWVTGWRTCFTQPTGLSVMKIKLLFNILTTRGYLRQLEGNKYHIRGFEEQFSWEDHMQELQSWKTGIIWYLTMGRKEFLTGVPVKVRTCRNLPIILQALSEVTVVVKIIRGALTDPAVSHGNVKY